MRRWFAFLAVTVACAFTLFSPSRAPAWGRQGHEITGRIADKHLDERARKAVHDLLKGDQFQSLSDGRLNSWADAVRSSAAFRRKYPTMAQLLTAGGPLAKGAAWRLPARVASSS
jgi:hypothetical protein